LVTKQCSAFLISTVLLLGTPAPGLGSEIGGWSTAGIVGAWADFAIPEFDTDRLFLLSCTENVDEDLIEYLLWADGRLYPLTFSEGGAVLAEARGPRVQQHTPGTPSTLVPCRVQLFPEGYDQPISFLFEARHAVPEQILAFHPDRPRRFRIDFDIPSLAECREVTMRPLVNGRYVFTPDDQPFDLQVGASFWGVGHSLAVTTASGDGDDCPTNTPISGTVTVHPL